MKISSAGLVTITWSDPIYLLKNLTNYINDGAIKVRFITEYDYEKNILRGFNVEKIDS